ncbi:LemA family protein [Agrococcus sp. ARC_14]|uniref:LemA family protein n=1 Tax=Agrococcus sp. ARC_14 TaxID=2919927 RepID=UPI001F050E8E|nr:LemA family protein [Agrococcus sp. ARC_14]MCH1882395.1 LemA family protein [Agrococcus sp. ARC_14]
MDPLLVVWIIAGALVVLGLIGLIATLASRASMRRLSATVDERWSSLTASLERRKSVAEPLLASATEQQRGTVADAFTALEQAMFPSTKAEAEAEVQRVLRPLVQAAGSQPAGSDAAEARAALAALDDEAQARRRDYNTSARELNAKARRFPTSAFAKVVAAPREFFEVDNAGAVAEPPRIQF